MIVLDTNVVSEMMKPEPNPSVHSWLNQQAANTMYLSTITFAELLFGIASLPDGKRKNNLSLAFESLRKLFRDRVLPFDIDASKSYAQLAATARANERGFPTPDGYIAAIAASRGFIVATRDTAPFEAAHVEVINPWKA